MKFHIVSFLLLLFVSIQVSSQVFEAITVEQAQDTIAVNAENELFTILDVRTPGEYEIGHLAQAHNRDFYDDDFALQLDSLDKSRTYLIYCQSGGRSGSTMPIMEDLGFERVYDMIGGMSSWLNADFPATTNLPDPVNIYAVASSIDRPSFDFILYPNPTEGLIQFSASFEKIELFNAQGFYLYQEKGEVGLLDLSQLQPGTYFAKISLNGEKFVKRVVRL